MLGDSGKQLGQSIEDDWNCRFGVRLSRESIVHCNVTRWPVVHKDDRGPMTRFRRGLN